MTTSQSARELSRLAEKLSALDDRVAEVERVNARLEEAALSTATALAEVSRHWDAVYDALRRADESTARSRPSATTKRLGRVAASHRILLAKPDRLEKRGGEQGARKRARRPTARVDDILCESLRAVTVASNDPEGDA